MPVLSSKRATGRPGSDRHLSRRLACGCNRPKGLDTRLPEDSLNRLRETPPNNPGDSPVRVLPPQLSSSPWPEVAGALLFLPTFLETLLRLLNPSDVSGRWLTEWSFRQALVAGIVQGTVQLPAGIERVWIQGGKLGVDFTQPLADALFVAAVAVWTVAGKPPLKCPHGHAGERDTKSNKAYPPRHKM